jgi:hypothetical protein
MKKKNRASKRAHMLAVADDHDNVDLFVVFDGKRIAKRGHPGTRHAMTWIPLEPGFSVISSPDHDNITIKYQGLVLVQ